MEWTRARMMRTKTINQRMERNPSASNSKDSKTGACRYCKEQSYMSRRRLPLQKTNQTHIRPPLTNMTRNLLITSKNFQYFIEHYEFFFKELITVLIKCLDT